MRTRRAPWDYNKPRTCKNPVDVRLCTICGNHVVSMPDGNRCITCGNRVYVDVPEYLVDTVRCGLVMIQWEKAVYLAGLMPDIGGAIPLIWEAQS